MHAIQTKPERSANALVRTLLLGMMSATLYLLLYRYSSNLTDMATLIRQGHKGYVVVPMGIALAVSFIHGAFTGRFWDLLGLKAKQS